MMLSLLFLFVPVNHEFEFNLNLTQTEYALCYQSNNIRNVCFSLGVYTVTSYKDPAVQTDSPSAQFQPPVRDPALCSILSNFRRNVTDLRLQLHQLKQMQVHRKFKWRASALSTDEFLIYDKCLSCAFSQIKKSIRIVMQQFNS